MNESDFTTLVERARAAVPPGTPPTAEILVAAHRSVRRRRLALAGSTAAVLVLVATGVGLALDPTGNRTTDAADGDAAHLSGQWLLTSGTVAGRPLAVQPDHPVTFVVERRGEKLSAGGQSACNHYATEITASGSSIQIRGSESTAMGCPGPVQALESAYHQALGDVTDFAQTPDRLRLTGPAVNLEFEPLPPVPTAQLVDTTWELETIADGDTASSVTGKPVLQLRSDGSFTMTSGCGLVLTGTWAESSGTITVTSSSAEGGCQQHPQSQAVLAASDSFYVEITGDRLTITGRHGGQLVYRSR